MKELYCKFFDCFFHIFIMLSLRSLVPLCSYSVDEIELVFKDTVVESFGVNAQSSFCLNTWDGVHLQD